MEHVLIKNLLKMKINLQARYQIVSVLTLPYRKPYFLLNSGSCNYDFVALIIL